MITVFSLIFFALLFHPKHEYYFYVEMSTENFYIENSICRIDIDTYITYVYRIFSFSAVQCITNFALMFYLHRKIFKISSLFVNFMELIFKAKILESRE